MGLLQRGYPDGAALIVVFGEDRHRNRCAGPGLFKSDIVWLGQKISYTGFSEDKLRLASVCFDLPP
jgi:hypothetical protein